MPVPAMKLATAGPMSGSEVVKIVVTNSVVTSENIGTSQNRHMQLNKRTSLTQVVEELCRHWSLPNPEDCALTFETTKEYVTDRTKDKVGNGTVLKLCQSPKRIILDLFDIIEKNKDSQLRLNSFKALEQLSSEYACAEQLVKENGLELIIKCICQESTNSHLLPHLIITFYEIMKHEDLVSWNDIRISEAFVKHVAAFVQNELTNSTEMKALQSSLAFLETVVCTPAKVSYVEKAVSVPSLLALLQSDNSIVQQNALALFNALFKISDRAKKMKMKQAMEERKIRRVIIEHIIRKKPSEEMKQQLYILQSLLFNFLEDKMKTKVDINDQKAMEKVRELRKLAFEGQAGHLKGKPADDFKKLGFSNDDDPTSDFKVPPGMLALELIYLFAINHTDHFTRMIYDSSTKADGHECPFALVAIETVNLICQIIRIGQPPLDSGVFLPMFFAYENPLEEMFAVTIQHVHKTWREMRATIEDFSKVADVAKEQITTALRLSPMSLEEYKRSLKTYNEINELRKEEAKNRVEKDSKAIKVLREMLTQDTVELIQSQRLKFLVTGTRFSKYKKEGVKERGKFTYLKLSANRKTLLYGDWADEVNVPKADELPNKIPVSEIKDFFTGADCAQLRDTNRRNRDRTVDNLAFAIIKENGDSVEFIAPNAKTFDYWCDGINTLLGRKMTSAKAAEDLEMFLSMEVKIRLLDVEGFEIMDDPPTIPPLPSSADFKDIAVSM